MVSTGVNEGKTSSKLSITMIITVKTLMIYFNFSIEGAKVTIKVSKDLTSKSQNGESGLI